MLEALRLSVGVTLQLLGVSQAADLPLHHRDVVPALPISAQNLSPLKASTGISSCVMMLEIIPFSISFQSCLFCFLSMFVMAFYSSPLATSHVPEAAFSIILNLLFDQCPASSVGISLRFPQISDGICPSRAARVAMAGPCSWLFWH